VATVLSFEGADGFADKPDDLTAWVRRGVCFVGLVHTRTNALAGSSTDPDPAQRRVGLTAAGRKVLEVAYRSGAVADGAHASDTAVDEIVALAKLLGAPVVITHTGMRALRATERNADDAHVALVAGTGGVVGIDIHSGHIARRKGATATLDEVVDHIEHAARVGGKDHVAIGSDLDGGIVQPSDADGAASWPLLARKLAARGWSAPEVEALFRGNASRVLGWARARGCGAGLARGASGG
jgi:membrane dipeptidase